VSYPRFSGERPPQRPPNQGESLKYFPQLFQCKAVKKPYWVVSRTVILKFDGKEYKQARAENM